MNISYCIPHTGCGIAIVSWVFDCECVFGTHTTRDVARCVCCAASSVFPGTQLRTHDRAPAVGHLQMWHITSLGSLCERYIVEEDRNCATKEQHYAARKHYYATNYIQNLAKSFQDPLMLSQHEAWERHSASRVTQ